MRPRQIGDATVAAREMFEDAPPRGVRQGGERAVQLARRTFNHMVKYYSSAADCASEFFAVLMTALLKRAEIQSLRTVAIPAKTTGHARI